MSTKSKLILASTFTYQRIKSSKDNQTATALLYRDVSTFER